MMGTMKFAEHFPLPGTSFNCPTLATSMWAEFLHIECLSLVDLKKNASTFALFFSTRLVKRLYCPLKSYSKFH